MSKAITAFCPIPTTEIKTKPEKRPTDHAVLKNGFVIAGISNITKKMLALVAEAVSIILDEYGVLPGVMITFKSPAVLKDGLKGFTNPELGSSVVYVGQTILDAAADVEAGKYFLSYAAQVWENILAAAFHEMGHNVNVVANAIESDGSDEKTRAPFELGSEEDEGAAKRLAEEILIKLASKFDVEPDEEFIAAMVQVCNEKFADKDWTKAELDKMANGVIYHDPEWQGGQAMTLKSFREYVRCAYDNAREDAEGHKLAPIGDWTTGVIPTSLVVHKIDGSVAEVKAEPTATAEVVAASIDDETGVDMGAIAQAMGAMGIPTMVAAPNAVVPPSPPSIPAAGALLNGFQLDAVTLPSAIATQQANLAAYTGMPNTQPSPQAHKNYADRPTNLNPDAVSAAAQALFMRLYTHFFTKCGWFSNGTQAGFNNPMAVLEPIDITDIIRHFNVPGLFAEMDTIQANGQSATVPIEGAIRGTIFRQSQLPGYDFYLNVGGVAHRRRLVPQNPNKANAQGQLTRSAAEARQGHMIAWVIDATYDKFRFSIKDNVIAELEDRK